MKVSILTDGIYPFVIGGAQKHNSQLAKSLASAGVQVEIFHPGKLDGKKSSWLKGIPNLKEISVPYSAKGEQNSCDGKLRDDSAYYQKLWELVKGSDSDIIYCQGLTGSVLLQNKIKGKFHIPIVVNLHGMDMFQPVIGFQPDSQRLADARQEAVFQLENADAVVSLGGKLGNILHTHKIPERRIWRIPVAIDEEWMEHPASKSVESRIFTFIGSDEKRKGLELFHHAIEILSARGDRPEIRIIGKVAPESRLKLPNVEYFGPAGSESEIMKFLDESSFLVLPSYCEGMPTVILEAMARGNAVITTDVGATSTLVDETNGMIIPVGDEQSLAEAIHHANSLPPHRLMAMFQASYSKVSEFEWPKVAKRNLEMFEQILEKDTSVSQ